MGHAAAQGWQCNKQCMPVYRRLVCSQIAAHYLNYVIVPVLLAHSWCGPAKGGQQTG